MSNGVHQAEHSLPIQASVYGKIECVPILLPQGNHAAIGFIEGHSDARQVDFGKRSVLGIYVNPISAPTLCDSIISSPSSFRYTTVKLASLSTV